MISAFQLEIHPKTPAAHCCNLERHLKSDLFGYLAARLGGFGAFRAQFPPYATKTLGMANSRGMLSNVKLFGFGWT